jgi:hypothetical protein
VSLAIGRATAMATAIAGNLAAPPAITDDRDRCLAQSLAKGAAGIALLHIERARTGLARWDTAHAWLKAAAGADISAADDAGLFAGAPAVAFAVRAAGAGRYTHALAKLDARVAALAHRRASLAQARIDSGTMPPLAEFDLIYGLTGIGAYLLRSDPGGSALEHVLRYLVRLTEPLRDDGQMLPGWWTSHDPSFKYSPGFAGGHANFGIAHGIAVIFRVKSSMQLRAAVGGCLRREARESRWLVVARGQTSLCPRQKERFGPRVGRPRHVFIANVGEMADEFMYVWHERPVPAGLEIRQVYGYLLCPQTARVLIQDVGGGLAGRAGSLRV